MKTIKGPAIFLAQFAADETPYNTLDSIAQWAAGHGYIGVQIPSWDGRLFDLGRAADSKTYCDEVRGILARHGIAPTELGPNRAKKQRSATSNERLRNASVRPKDFEMPERRSVGLRPSVIAIPPREAVRLPLILGRH